MSVEQEVQAALIGALGTISGLNGVFDGPVAKSSAPWAETGELLRLDWSTKDIAGCEMRTGIIIRDRAATPERVHQLADAAGAAVEALPRTLGDWRIASLMMMRQRIVRDGPGQWAALIEHRLRLLAEG